MFDIERRTYKNIFIRPVHDKINKDLLIFFISNLKDDLINVFFQKMIIVSWSVFTHTNNIFYEIIYTVSRENISESEIMYLYEYAIQKSAKEILYKEYIYFSNQLNIKNGFLGKVIKILEEQQIKNKHEVLSENEFNKQLKILNSVVFNSFRKNEVSKVKEIKLEKITFLKDIENNVEINDLVFVGKYFYFENVETLEQFLRCRLLEKVIGGDDTQSIYFKHRENGDIYAALTNFVKHINILITGCLIKNESEKIKKILKSIDCFEFTQEKLIYAKELLHDDIKFNLFQYGELYTLLPFKLYDNQITSIKELLKKIDSISMNEIKELINVQCYKIIVGV